MNYWLMKSELDSYSIDTLEEDKKTEWTGVRNYQARNFMRDTMKVGDLALFYHSNTKHIGVYGIAQVATSSHPDITAFDSKSPYYDPKSTKQKPIWECVDFAFVQKFSKPVLLDQIKKDVYMQGIMVNQKGSRLSIQPVHKKHFDRIITLGSIV